MTEDPVSVSSGTCHKARGCHEASSILDGDAGLTNTCRKQNGFAFNYHVTCDSGLTGPVSTEPGTCPEPNKEGQFVVCKRKCGCTRISHKVKELLQSFPTPPPPEALHKKKTDKACGFSYGQPEKPEKSACRICDKLKEAELGACAGGKDICSASAIVPVKEKMSCGRKSTSSNRSWQIVSELVSLVQLSVTATALALYYLIYCYMQLVYYTLRSALYFHNADGPMKITIGVVTLTSLIVGFNILMRMEGIIGIIY